MSRSILHRPSGVICILAFLLTPSFAFQSPKNPSFVVSSHSSSCSTAASTSSALSVVGGGQSKQRLKEMLEFIESPGSSSVGDDVSDEEIDPDILAATEAIVRAADSRKADDIRCLGVAHITTLTNVIVVVTGNSRPQNQAIAAAIQEAMEDMDTKDTRVEGTADSGWMLLDYGSIMVHVMTPKSRLFYNIEGQWRDKGGRYWDEVESWLVPNSMVESEDSTATAAEDDPFWS